MKNETKNWFINLMKMLSESSYMTWGWNYSVIPIRVYQMFIYRKDTTFV